jgi:hypothetical protein
LRPWRSTPPVEKTKIIDVVKIDPVDIQALKDAKTIAQLKTVLEKIILGN